jgi:phosphoserine phosphatase
VPLIGDDGQLVGVAQVLNKRAGAPGDSAKGERFTAHDEEIAQALAAHAAVAMRRGRLIEDRLVRQKLERDLELARTIQQSSFPDRLPQVAGFEIAAWNQPAEQTGGDVFDAVARSESTAEQQNGRAQERPSDRVVLLMADATGHGIGPALSATQLRSMLRMGVRLGASLDQIAHHANQQLHGDLPGGRFITAWLGELDAHAGALTSLSVGQAPLLWYDATRDAFEISGADAVPLGVLDTIALAAPQPRLMGPGDLFAAVSDGVYEAHRSSGQPFGTDRVLACLRDNRHRSAEEILAALRRALEVFLAGAPVEDDRTAILIKRT